MNTRVLHTVLYTIISLPNKCIHVFARPSREDKKTPFCKGKKFNLGRIPNVSILFLCMKSVKVKYVMINKQDFKRFLFIQKIIMKMKTQWKNLKKNGSNTDFW